MNQNENFNKTTKTLDVFLEYGDPYDWLEVFRYSNTLN